MQNQLDLYVPAKSLTELKVFIHLKPLERKSTPVGSLLLSSFALLC